MTIAKAHAEGGGIIRRLRSLPWACSCRCRARAQQAEGGNASRWPMGSLVGAECDAAAGSLARVIGSRGRPNEHSTSLDPNQQITAQRVVQVLPSSLPPLEASPYPAHKADQPIDDQPSNRDRCKLNNGRSEYALAFVFTDIPPMNSGTA